MNMFGNIGRGVVVTSLAMIAASCGSEEAAQPAATETKETLQARVAGDAVMLMDRESFSDTYAKLGEQQFQNANDLTRWAAIAAVAQGPDCDRVEIIGISGRSTREHVEWFVDCENGERILVEQPEAEKARLRYHDDASPEGEI